MEQPSTLFLLSIEALTKSHLESIAKWAKLLAIAGMVLLAFAVIGSFISINMISESRPYIESQQEQALLQSVRLGTIVGALMIILIVFFPLLFLLRFSIQLKTALRSDSQEELNLAFQNLKRYFRYLGIMLIIGCAFYGVTLLVTLMAAKV